MRGIVQFCYSKLKFRMTRDVLTRGDTASLYVALCDLPYLKTRVLIKEGSCGSEGRLSLVSCFCFLFSTTEATEEAPFSCANIWLNLLRNTVSVKEGIFKQTLYQLQSACSMQIILTL